MQEAVPLALSHQERQAILSLTCLLGAAVGAAQQQRGLAAAAAAAAGMATPNTPDSASYMGDAAAPATPWPGAWNMADALLAVAGLLAAALLTPPHHSQVCSRVRPHTCCPHPTPTCCSHMPDGRLT